MLTSEAGLFTSQCNDQRLFTLQAKAKSMPKHRVFGNHGRDEDGKPTRTVHSPGGNTRVGMQTFNTTPNGRNEAWLFKCPDEKAREQDDVQSIRNSRKKAKRESKTGMGARVPLARRAESLGVGSAEGMTPKALSQVVLRAERRTNEEVIRSMRLVLRLFPTNPY